MVPPPTQAHHISLPPLLQRKGPEGLRWSFQGVRLSIGPAPIPSALVDTWGQRELSPKGATVGGLVCPWEEEEKKSSHVRDGIPTLPEAPVSDTPGSVTIGQRTKLHFRYRGASMLMQTAEGRVCMHTLEA